MRVRIGIHDATSAIISSLRLNGRNSSSQANGPLRFSFSFLGVFAPRRKDAKDRKCVPALITNKMLIEGYERWPPLSLERVWLKWVRYA